MGKPKRERSLAETEAKAITRNLRVSPQKLNLVAGLIRGKKVNAALADLEFSKKRIAQDVRKCVMSAVANADLRCCIDLARPGSHHLDERFNDCDVRAVQNAERVAHHSML